MKDATRNGFFLFLPKLVLVFAGMLLILFSAAQKFPSGQKLSPVLSMEIKNGLVTGKKEFRLTVKSENIPTVIFEPEDKAKKIYESLNFSIFSVNTSVEKITSKYLSHPGIIFIESGTRSPKEELQVSNLDLSVNKINLAHRQFPGLNGDGIVISVKENKPDTADIDFTGRYLSTSLSSPSVSTHASIMATMIAGGGNSWHLGKGAAWGSTISSSSFATLLPDANSAYQQYNISVQNHSYGVGVESYYGSDAASYDASTISNNSLLHIFSSGNAGNLSPSTGNYTGITGFANLTGSFKMAKNILTVGATDSFSSVASLSSKGPAHDGRVKPELVAFGEDGSSGAAALVSGAALILQHAFKQNNGVLPPNTLIKAILLNSADDAGNTNVDYHYGYGAMNAGKAITTLLANRYFSGSVIHSGSQSFLINIPSGIKKIKATLVWNDPPAAPNASKALINDLDLELIEVSSGQSWKPWVLNPFPHPDSLMQPAKRKRDSLNNIEQVTLDDPSPGNYQLKVTGYNIITASQNFHIAWQLDSTDEFEWQFPTANDFILPSSSGIIRWKSSFATLNGNIEYSIDNGNTWLAIQNGIALNAGYFRWIVPSVTSKSLLRMTIGASQFISDTFTIAPRTTTGVGFNCPDSFLFFWHKLQAISNYRVYKLGNKYLEPIAFTPDSFVLLAKNSNPSLHYTVAPIIGNREGVRSYTFNYTTQGVECYIRSFLASLVNNTAQLRLSLGTLYNVNRIVLEKYIGTGYTMLQQVNNPANPLMNFTDASLQKGLNSYRIKLELTGGRIIYSSVETVYYFRGDEFIVYPNPVMQYQPLTVLSDNQFEPATLQVINMQGQKIFQMPVDDITNHLPVGRLSKGIFLFRFVRKGRPDTVIKVLVD